MLETLPLCERIDAQLSDLDAVLYMVSVAIASPEASLHTAETKRLIFMSRRIVQWCRDFRKTEGWVKADASRMYGKGEEHPASVATSK